MNKEYKIIPYMIFIILLMNSISIFLLSKMGTDSLAISISSGLLMMVLFLFLLANLSTIYSRTGFYIKMIFPWILFMWATSGVLIANQSFRNILRAACFQSGPLLIFLCFFIQGKNCTDRTLKANQRLFFILTVVTASFFSYEVIRGKTVSSDFLAIGQVLYLTMLLPWVSIRNNKVVRYILLAGLSCLALFSMKRSALLQISIGGLFYVLIQNVILEQKKKGLYLFLVPFALLGLFLIVSYVDRSTSGALFERVRDVQEDRGSGRLEIWADLVSQYNSWPFINKLFGKGYFMTSEILGKVRAHNDFLEALLSYGIIGFLANLFFGIYLLIKAAGMVLRRHPYSASFVFGVISFWIASLVSYNLYTMYWSLYLLAFLGYICGIDQQGINLYSGYAEFTSMDSIFPDDENYYNDQYPLEMQQNENYYNDQYPLEMQQYEEVL